MRWEMQPKQEFSLNPQAEKFIPQGLNENSLSTKPVSATAKTLRSPIQIAHLPPPEPGIFSEIP